MDMNNREYFVQREVLDDARLDEVAKEGNWTTQPTIGERVKEYFRCSASRLKLILLSFIPILAWLPQYPFKEYIFGDLISGASIASLHLPMGLAYAPLAGLRPVYGLYTSFYPVLLYVIFGTSKHLSVGTFAVTSIMVGNVVQDLAPDGNFLVNGTNGTTVNTNARDAYRVEIAMALTIVMGIYQILMGMLKFGFMVTYLSEPLIRAYTTASAVLVTISQLKFMFGVSPALYSGPLSPVLTFINVCKLLPKTRPVEVIITVLSIAFLVPVKEFNNYYKHKLPLPIPIELFLIIFATIIVHFGGLTTKFGVSVVGVIPSGFTAPFAPYTNLYGQVAAGAFAVAIVSYTINISLAKTLARKFGYKVDNNQELLATGIGNIVGGFFQCYAVTASLSRSLVQVTTGGKTQVAGIFSSILMLIAILKIGSLFQDLPKAVLAMIVVVNLKGMFEQLVDIPILWKTNKVDLLVWLVTFISAILLNLDMGLAVAVGFAVLTVIFRTQLPRYSILGLVPGTDLYLDTETYKEAKEIPGIKIFRSSTTTYYANAEMYLDALQAKIGIDILKLLTAKKKIEADLKRKEEKEKKKAKKEAKKQQKNGVGHLPIGPFSLKETNDEYSERLRRQSEGNVSEFSLTVNTIHNTNAGQVNWAYQHDPTILDSTPDKGCQDDGSINQVSSPIEEGRGGTHSIILDISTLNFADTVTVTTLQNIFTEFGQVNLDVYFTGCQACVVKQLETAGFFSDAMPKNRLFVTNHDAVLYILKKRSQTELVLDISSNTKM